MLQALLLKDINYSSPSVYGSVGGGGIALRKTSGGRKAQRKLNARKLGCASVVSMRLGVQLEAGGSVVTPFRELLQVNPNVLRIVGESGSSSTWRQLCYQCVTQKLVTVMAHPASYKLSQPLQANHITSSSFSIPPPALRPHYALLKEET